VDRALDATADRQILRDDIALTPARHRLSGQSRRILLPPRDQKSRASLGPQSCRQSKVPN
jgi:hypothetical protein